MSRADSQQITDTAKGQNATEYGNSQNSYTQAQQDAGEYQASLAKYAAANPYTQGGQLQTVQNQELTNTSDAAAQAAGQAMQSQAVRTGTNAGGSIAGTEASEQANERALGGDEAAATAARVGAGAAYDQSVLGATNTGVQQQTTLAGQEANAANSELGEENQASDANQSFADQFGASFSKGLGSALSGSSFEQGLGQGLTKGCWIAAELYGGWMEPRTVLVRGWLFGAFRKHWYGRLVTEIYLRVGERVADAIRRWPWLRKVFRPMFDRALLAAQKEVR